MKIKVRYSGDIAVVEMDGRLNINSSKLIEAVGSLLEGGTSKIILDMHSLDFVDYNGLSVLAIACKSILNHKGCMKLCRVSLHIMELLRIVKLDEVFEIYTKLDDAIESFKKKVKLTKDEILEQPLRRKFMRLDMDIPVYYRLSKKFSHRGKNGLCAGRMDNISGAGLFIRTIDIFPPGAELAIELALEKGKKPISMKGMIIWIPDKGLQPDLYPGMGVEFINLSPHTQERIIEFIEKNVVHRKG